MSGIQRDTMPLSNDMRLANYDFSLKLLQQLNTGNQNANVFLSPASISLVLAMCYLGADGQTKNAMKQTLYGSGQEDDKVKTWSQKILRFASESSDKYQLRFANRIYLNERFRLKQDYAASVHQVFNASVLSGNFKTNAAKITRDINSWVEQVTKNKIKELVARGVIDDGTIMLLVNALYFKGAWEDKFDEHGTKKQDFYVTENQKVQVDMMHLTASKRYYEDQDIQVLELRYIDSPVSMIIVLPREKNGLQNVLRTMDGRKLAQLVANMGSQRVVVELPKFKMENSFNLNDALTKLGLEEAFSENANFSKMTEIGAKISKVVHKSFIRIDENGTEAAAATYVEMVPWTAALPHPTPKKFTADHPFLVLLTVGDRNGKEILFMGKFHGTSD